MTTISIIGLGYVGTTLAACLAADGSTRVIGMDTDRQRAEAVAASEPPFVERGLHELLQNAVESGRLTVTDDVRMAVAESEITFVCVGTPALTSGLGYGDLQGALGNIGQALAGKDKYHLVVIRSTLTPGTMRGLVVPTLEIWSRKTAGHDFGVCYNPEFLREGSAVYDYWQPPFVVIGSERYCETTSDGVAAAKAEGETAIARLRALYAPLPAPIFTVSYETAEMLKLSCNAWHALKVCFANEIGNVCQAVGADSHELMRIFTQDHRLNLGPTYLRPGFAYGGSCLSKDVHALLVLAAARGLAPPLLAAIEPSNERQIELACQAIAATKRRRIGIIGLSHKPGSGDLRDSQALRLIREMLRVPEVEVRAYDENVPAGHRLDDDGRARVVPTAGAVARWCEILVLVHGTEADIKPRPGQLVLDLARVLDDGAVNALRLV